MFAQSACATPIGRMNLHTLFVLQLHRAEIVDPKRAPTGGPASYWTIHGT